MKETKEEDIKVNRRKGDKAVFESNLLQQISDGIDFLKDDGKDVLRELDAKGLNEEALGEFGESTLNHISDVVDEMSQLKSEIIDEDELPESIRKSSRDLKVALNRDEDYVRRAKRRLDRINDGDFVDASRANLRVVELCNKAIDVNRSNKKAYYLKGCALINLEKYGAAIEEFINSLAIEEDIDSYIGIAHANRLNGDYEDAIDVYDKVLEKNEGSFEAFEGKGLAYYALDDFKEAYNSFRKADEVGSLGDESQKLMDECFEKI